MELRVWTDDGISRVVCGVTEATTCRDVILAVAQVTGGVGKYSITLCLGDVCKSLSPTDKPIIILGGLGESDKDIKFFVKALRTSHKKLKTKLKVTEIHPFKQRNVKKSLTFNAPKTCFVHQAEDSVKLTVTGSCDHLVVSKRLSRSGAFRLRRDYLENGNELLNGLPDYCKLNTLNLQNLGPGHSQTNLLHENKRGDESVTSLISEEKVCLAKLKHKNLQFKSEIESMEDSLNIERKKINDCLKKMTELQSEENRVDNDLKELELVSWNDKLNVEITRGHELKLDRKEADTQLENLLGCINNLDEEITTLKERILIEEGARQLHESEIYNFKQELAKERDQMGRVKDVLNGIDSNISNLQLSLRQKENDISKHLVILDGLTNS